MSKSNSPKLRTSAATVVAPTILPPESDAAGKAKLAKGDAKPEVHVDQHVVDAFLTAEGGVREAAVNLFRACIGASVAPSQFGARSDAKTRASEFNRAWYARGYFGPDVVREMIDKAAENPGDRRANVLSALRKACEYGKQVKSAKLKGAALSKALSKAAAESVKAAEASGAAGETVGRRGAQHQTQRADTLEKYATLALATVGSMQEKLGKLDIPARKLGKVRDLGAALDEVADILKSLAPKS